MIDPRRVQSSMLPPTNTHTPSHTFSLSHTNQADAKRAVANALRNRWRRHRVPASLRDEIVPKNILMIGPTGCGKTEIARRLAKLAGAPFVKVEATKFTEVGFHGRDVDQIIRDLVDNAVVTTRERMKSTITTSGSLSGWNSSANLSVEPKKSGPSIS